MTTAELILTACGVVGVLITAAGWFISVGRQGQKIATLEVHVSEIDADLAKRATTDDLAALNRRTTEVEHSMREIDEVKSMVDRLGQAITHQGEIAALNQTLVVQKVEAGQVLTNQAMDEVKHRLRNVSTVLQAMGQHVSA